MALTAGVHLIKAEVAVSEAEKRQGLMYRQSLGKNDGMLFVYAEPIPLCMWMKNTNIPLSVAFIDIQGKIVNIADMTPHSIQAHCARRPVSYALEMRRGWFREKNINAGSVIGGLNGGQ